VQAARLLNLSRKQTQTGEPPVLRLIHRLSCCEATGRQSYRCGDFVFIRRKPERNNRRWNSGGMTPKSQALLQSEKQQSQHDHEWHKFLHGKHDL
jgi:hypothetical protein